MTNADYIEKYKDQDEIIRTYFQVRDKYGQLNDIDGVVSPLKIDNRQLASPTDQQGETPHCAGYSICSIVEAINWKRTGKIYNLDADQVYARAKLLDGSKNSEGTFLEYAIQAALQLGGFKNPQDIKIGFLYNDGGKKTVDAFKHLIHKYDFLHCGFNISTGWYSCNDAQPVIRHTNICCGGHAVVAVGYDQQGVYIQNSWGITWGSKGFGILPWDAFKQELIYCCYLQNCYNGLEG